MHREGEILPPRQCGSFDCARGARAGVGAPHLRRRNRVAIRNYYRVDWDDLAHDRGFDKPALMLAYFYLHLGLTQEEIGRELGISAGIVGQQMKYCGIPVRKPGGGKLGELRGPRLPRGG